MTASQEKARRKKNPASTYSTALMHHETLPCNSRTTYGLEKTKDVNKVNCITCKRILKNKGKLK